MEMAKESVILHILPLIDNIERALNHRPSELKDNDWANGVEQVAKQVEATLKELDVTKVDAVGQVFNPELHEAVGYEDGEGDSPEGEEVVAEELQAGYKIGDRVIRHSIVKVKKEK
jgi:molecular chaperone GrpE